MIKYLSVIAVATVSLNANAIQIIKDNKNDVKVTGLAYAGHIFGDEKDSQMYGDNTFVRFGADAKTVINDQLTAIGKYEAQLRSNVVDSESSGTDTRTRFIFGGVKTNGIGTFTFGRQDGAIYANVAKWTDVTYTDNYGGKATGIVPDRFGTRRSSDVLKYEGEFGKAILAASYKFKTTRDQLSNNNIADESNSAYGVAASYEIFNYLNIGAGYANGNRADSVASTGTITHYDDNAQLYVLGVKYDDKAWYAALTYSNGTDFVAYNADHFGYEAVVGYMFKNGFGLEATGQKMRIKNTTTNEEKDGYNAYTLGAKYNFSKNLSAAIEYRINNLGENAYPGYKVYAYGSSENSAVNAANDLQVAVMYQF